MKKILLALAAVTGVAMVFGKRRPKEEQVERWRHGAEDAFVEMEHRIADLREQATRLSGEARQRLQDQAHDLEGQQRDLRNRMNDLRGEAQRLVDRARSRSRDLPDQDAEADEPGE